MTMKKLFAMMTMIALICAMFVSPALAEKAEFANTQSFLDVLDANDFVYTLAGLDSDGDEKVEIENNGDALTYYLNYYFTEDNELVSIRIWNLISYSDEDFINVLREVNAINYDYRYVCFVADETDNTVTVKYDVILRPGDAVGDIVFEESVHMASIIDEAFSRLAPYNQQ